MNQPRKKSGYGNRGKTNYVFPPPLLLLTNQDEKAADQNKRRSFTQNPLRIRVAYEKYIGSKDFSFGWQEPINKSRIFVMHFPLRGEAIVRTRELTHLLQATREIVEC